LAVTFFCRQVMKFCQIKKKVDRVVYLLTLVYTYGYIWVKYLHTQQTGFDG
jgi:hypothetical protein